MSGAIFVKAVLFMRCAPVTLATTVAATEPIGNTFRRLGEPQTRSFASAAQVARIAIPHPTLTASWERLMAGFDVFLKLDGIDGESAEASQPTADLGSQVAASLLSAPYAECMA